MNPKNKERILKEVCGEDPMKHSKYYEVKEAISLAHNKCVDDVLEVVEEYRKDMNVLKGDTEFTFEEHIGNFKAKLKEMKE